MRVDSKLVLTVMQRTRSVMIVWKEIKEEKEVDNKEKIAI